MSLTKAAGPFFISSLLQWSNNFMALTRQNFTSIENTKQLFDVVKKKRRKGIFLTVYSLWQSMCCLTRKLA